MKRPSRKVFVIVALLALAGATWTCSACSTAYVLRAGYEEAKILAARRPIEEVARLACQWFVRWLGVSPV